MREALHSNDEDREFERRRADGAHLEEVDVADAEGSDGYDDDDGVHDEVPAGNNSVRVRGEREASDGDDDDDDEEEEENDGHGVRTRDASAAKKVVMGRGERDGEQKEGSSAGLNDDEIDDETKARNREEIGNKISKDDEIDDETKPRDREETANKIGGEVQDTVVKLQKMRGEGDEEIERSDDSGKSRGALTMHVGSHQNHDVQHNARGHHQNHDVQHNEVHTSSNPDDASLCEESRVVYNQVSHSAGVDENHAAGMDVCGSDDVRSGDRAECVGENFDLKQGKVHSDPENEADVDMKDA